MRLKVYISNVLQISVTDAAKDYVNSTGRSVHPETFRTWVNGKAMPRRDEMSFIVSWSKNNVSPNDFYELPAPSCDDSHVQSAGCHGDQRASDRILRNGGPSDAAKSRQNPVGRLPVLSSPAEVSS